VNASDEANLTDAAEKLGRFDVDAAPLELPTKFPGTGEA
jgi:hypothetical protein